MKTIYIILSLAFTSLRVSFANDLEEVFGVLQEPSEEQKRQWEKETDQINYEIIVAVSEQLPKIQKSDRILIYELHPEERAEQGFPIRPYGVSHKILKEKEITERDELALLKASFITMLPDGFGGGAFCHYPAHGIRFFEGQELQFETSICWACSNYYIPFKGSYSWKGMNDSSDLFEFFQSKLPLSSESKAEPVGTGQPM